MRKRFSVQTKLENDRGRIVSSSASLSVVGYITFVRIVKLIHYCVDKRMTLEKRKPDNIQTLIFSSLFSRMR